MELDEETINSVSHAGQLLIRALAVIAELSTEQQEQLRHATDGNIPDLIGMSLRSAKELCPEVRESIKYMTKLPVGVLV